VEKLTVRLRDDLVLRNAGFTDVVGNQEIRHKKGETVQVNRTPFVNQKIQSGEITVVSTDSTDESAKTESSEPTDPQSPVTEPQAPAQNAKIPEKTQDKSFLSKALGK
jgi:hypothetical protein